MDLQGEYLRNARKKARGLRSYFDDDEDEDLMSGSRCEATSNGATKDSKGAGEAEIDPLDAFMAGIDAQVNEEKASGAATKRATEKPSRFEDEHDSYLEDLARTHKKPRGARGEYANSDEEVYAAAKDAAGDSDDDDPKKSRMIEALAPLEHSKIVYEVFRKNLYKPHEAIMAMSEEEVQELRAELEVATDGNDVPRPIRSFMEAGFDRKMLAMLMKLGLEAPTPIQSQAFPVAMSGRDIIGIAKTGSGKTLAFTLPMVVHVMDQRELLKDEGPIAIVLSPTRELAHQIFVQAKKFLTVYGAHCAAVYGGVGKWDQIQALRKGAEVVVATPGRLIDVIRKKTVKTRRVTFVVLDEADRMFEMGFEPQLRSIMGQIRPDRQTLMFSATFRKRVEALARDVLHDPVKITIGKIGQANEEIHQIAVVLPHDNAKWPWLMANLKTIAGQGRVLIFAGSKAGCEEMTKNLNLMNFASNCLHGDKGQQERNEALAKFKSGECSILVATDVASRGLDVKDVKTVINYDTAKNIDTHVHRIGRTGRMGTEGFEPGTAYTLLTSKESQFAAQLVYNMDVSGQTVAADLVALARRDPRFRRGPKVASGQSIDQGHITRPSPFDTFDDEDEVEMARWNSQKKSKAEQRKGLGFGGTVSRGGFSMSFVKASSAQSLQQSFQTGFVKATTTVQESQSPFVPHQPSSVPPKVLPPPPQPLAALQPLQSRMLPLPPPVSETTVTPSQLNASPEAPSTVQSVVSESNNNAPRESSRGRDSRRSRSRYSRSSSSSRGRSRARSTSRDRERSRRRGRSRSRSRSRDRHDRDRSRYRRRRSRSVSSSRIRSRSHSRSRSRSSHCRRRSTSRSRGRYRR